MKIRIGQGFDIHRLVVGRRLLLGGVEIPFELGLLGHSDGDVVLHAACDALLGAIGEGDIGTHFPDTDPRYRDADSAAFLAEVARLTAARGYSLGNLQVNVIAERPRLAPHFAAMRDRIARILSVSVDAISVTARTMEGLDAVGRGEAIAALAICLVQADQP